MLRTLCAFAVLLAATSPGRAADPTPPAGNWKLTIPVDRGEEAIMLVAFAAKEGVWTGEYLGTTVELKAKPTVTSVKVNGDAVQFSLGFMGRELVSFDGTLSKDKKKLNGSMKVLGGRSRLTTMLPSKLAKLDDEFALARETLEQTEDGAELFSPAFEVLTQAGAKKVPVAEVRGIVERVNKTATAFGPRWEREVALRTVEILASQEGLGELAVAQAKRAERLLTDDDTAATRLAVIETIARTLTKAGKTDDAKPYVAQIARLELRDFAEYAKTHPPFKPTAFTGRKAKSDRTAVVEAFTDASHAESVGPLLAFDGLLKTYKPADVILLQYHVPFESPGPLLNDDALQRVRQYQDAIKAAPALFVSGNVAKVEEGRADGSEKAYKVLRTDIEKVLETPSAVKLALAVTKAEKGGFSAKATVADLEMPGEKMTLRFVLAEERVRYTGTNGLRYHHLVVRGLPGGAKGFALTKKTHEETVMIDPEAVKTALAKYLDDIAKKGATFADRPLALRNLKLVALVQNDATKEILQAVQVDLEAK